MGGLLGLPRERSLGGGWSLRLLPAAEELAVRREGEALADEERDRALCVNACLVAHGLRKNGRAVFRDGQAVLKRLTAGQIGAIAHQWGEFDRACNPKPWDEEAVDRAKKAWSTRLMSAFNGVCSRLLAYFRPRRGRKK